MAGDEGSGDREATKPFDIAFLASTASPREVTSATFSYVDAMLAGRMSDAELSRLRDEILGGSASGAEAEQDPVEAVRAQVARGDYSNGLTAAEALLERMPEHPELVRLADECRRWLADLYQRYVGQGCDVPQLVVDPGTLGDAGLDRWSAYLLSRVDGTSTIDELVDLTGFTRLDTLRLLYELAQRRIVRIARGAPDTPPSSGGQAVLARVKLKRMG